MKVPKKPVTILTGFLGAGKTTYLNHLLELKKDTQFAIIENEFGEQGVDGELVVRPDETIVEINNGCLCCTLNDNLYDILNELYDRNDEYDEIIIEATGVADPSGLASPFIVHPLIREQFPLKGVVCLVDAEMIEDLLEDTEEAKSQVAFSDVLLINKTDLVHPDYVSQLTKKLHEMNPIASILHGSKKQLPVHSFSSEETILDDLLGSGKKSIVGTGSSFPVMKPHGHHHHEHTKDVISHSFTFTHPFDEEQLRHHLYVYVVLQSLGLYRMKGVVWLEGSQNKHIVQSVGKRLDLSEGPPWADEDERKSVLVFIGKSLKREGVERLLQICLSRKVSSNC